MLKQIFILFIIISSLELASQSDSSLVIIDNKTEGIQTITDDSLGHSPKKAAILSAVLPSAGQYYNKKYWKMPIVYIGLGASIYFIDWNTNKLNHFRSKLKAEIDDDPNTINDSGYSKSDLSTIVNGYKRNRDLSYISLAAVYFLQIIDANVDAYLWSFDVGEDLSMTAMPTLLYSDTARPGLSLKINF